jgi:DNA-binding MarR family transcriptional regulator
MKKGQWTFLTNHGRVLAFISKRPQSTTREIAQEADITLRAVQKIITELEVEGYVCRKKEGRRNRYTVNPLLPMRHRLERKHAIGEVLEALGQNFRRKDDSQVK